MSGALHTGPVRVRPLESKDGLRILDDIEHAQFEIHTPTPVDPVPGDADTFRFPVDVTVRIQASRLTIPKPTGVIVRHPDGDTVARSMDRGDLDVPPGRYDIELPTAPVKLYLTVEAGITVRYDGTEMIIDFGTPTEASLGIRSFHERPAGTITTPADPESMMRAISLFGSALSTTSAERSFPTLRGHPPLLELGETFSAPDQIRRQKPETGVTLVLPPDREYVYPSVSLAYYLGAEVVPGRTARLVGDGWEYPLDDGNDFATTVNRTLQHIFFLDCLTRTEGLYPVDLQERRVVEDALTNPPDFGRLYDLPLAERLGEYLEIPFETLAPHRSTWHLTTDVLPTSTNAEMLPFVANDLSLIRCPDSPTATTTPEPSVVTNFYRNDSEASMESQPSDGAANLMRSTGQVRGTEQVAADSDVIHPTPADTVEHAWIGEGYPLGASKAMISSYRQRIERDVEEKSTISITVVCNDEQMRDEDVVAEFYGLRDILRFDIDVKYDLTVAELREALRTPTDFLHYIGHVDEEGIQCTDGALDVQTLGADAVAVDSFLLNACQSYQQGEALVERGSLGGVVTMTDVANGTATKLGRILARLLNCGFTLRTALSIAQEEVITGYQYIVIGDGGLTLCQSESGAPMVASIEQDIVGERSSISLRYYPASNYQPGSMMIPHFSDENSYCLCPGTTDERQMQTQKLLDFLDIQLIPVRTRSGLQWSDEFVRGR